MRIRDICLCIYIYTVWTYVCHFVLWPLHFFAHSEVDPSRIPLNRILLFVYLNLETRYLPIEFVVSDIPDFLWTQLSLTNLWSSFSIQIRGGGKWSWFQKLASIIGNVAIICLSPKSRRFDISSEQVHVKVLDAFILSLFHRFFFKQYCLTKE